MADVISCEHFEKYWDDYEAGRLTPDQGEALTEHRRNCMHCAVFGAESLQIRRSLQDLPKLEPSPYFVSNLMRFIHQLEQGGNRRKWAWEYRFNPVALSAGVAAALLLGFLLLRPMKAPMNLVAEPQTEALQNQKELQKAPEQNAPRRQIVPGASSDLLAAHEAEIDTAKHRLPEAPGQQRIPIPVEDDLWRLNQVSQPTSP